MIIDDLVQQSPEWMEMRKGCATGSCIADAVCLMKRQPKEGPPKYYAAREDYMFDIVVTRLTGLMPDHYVSRAMQYGIDQEPLARTAYELEYDATVDAVGLAFHPRIEWFAASPDGLIGNDGVLEIKCPNSTTHLRYVLDGGVPEEYVPQLNAEIVCSERRWADFVSYDPRMPEHYQLFVRRYEPTVVQLAEFEAEVEKFLHECNNLAERVRKASKSLTVRNILDLRTSLAK